jgi:hypothetical protein
MSPRNNRVTHVTTCFYVEVESGLNEVNDQNVLLESKSDIFFFFTE